MLKKPRARSHACVLWESGLPALPQGRRGLRGPRVSLQGLRQSSQGPLRLQRIPWGSVACQRKRKEDEDKYIFLNGLGKT